MVFNYLGFVWIECGEDMFVVLKMFECVYVFDLCNVLIVDLFGWVYYLIGDIVCGLLLIEGVVVEELVNVEIGEYFGDVYWMIGWCFEVCYVWCVVVLIVDVFEVVWLIIKIVWGLL